jgi:hypothetical protein
MAASMLPSGPVKVSATTGLEGRGEDSRGQVRVWRTRPPDSEVPYFFMRPGRGAQKLLESSVFPRAPFRARMDYRGHLPGVAP